MIAKAFRTLLALGALGMLAACGGGGAGGSGSAGGGGGGAAPMTTATIVGTAATGAPLAGATVTVKDANGSVVGRAVVGGDGGFSLTVVNPANYSPPLILRADPSPENPASGDEHYSILLDPLAAGRSYRVNVTPVTSLIVYEVTKRNLAEVYDTPALYKDLTQQEIDRARANVAGAFPQLQNLSNPDFMGQPFTANGTDPYDAALDALGVVSIKFLGDVPTLYDGDRRVIPYNHANPLFPVAAIALSAGMAQQVADGAGFNMISATVTNTQNGPAKGVRVNFTTTAGTLWDSARENEVASSVTDATGVARVYLRAPTMVGTATVRAESEDGGASQTATVTFVAGPVAGIGLNAQPTTLAPGTTTKLTAVVVDANGNLVADGQNVNFSVRTANGAVGGSFNGAPIVNRTTANGVVTLDYTAGLAAGTETIVATATNGTFRNLPLNIVVNPLAVGSVSLATTTATIPADGTSTAVLIATVRDSGNAPVAGATVNFSATAGVLPATVATTGADGVASVTLRSSTMALTSVVTASVSGYTASVPVTFGPTAPAVMSINVAPNAVRPGGTATLVVAVLDNNGNPVANEPITLGFDGNPGSGAAQLGATSGVTNAGGLVVFSYTAGAQNGRDKIRATTSNGLVRTVDIDVDARNAVVGSLAVTSTKPNIAVETGTSEIRATVRDAAGQPLSGITVEFAASAGRIDPSAVTDQTGTATVTLKAGPQMLVARIEASAAGFSATTQVTYRAGAPANVSVSAAPSTTRPALASNIFAYVTDAQGNPVSGETVTFAVTLAGSGQPSLSALTAVTNVDGLATIVYTAGHGAGTDTITARSSVDNVSGSASVTVSGDAVVVGNITLGTAGGVATLAADGVSSLTLRATVTDRTGSPAANVTVRFLTTGGSLSAANATTDANGVAEVSLTGTVPGRVTVRANADGFVDAIGVDFVAGPPAAERFGLVLMPDRVITGGTSDIYGIVLDAHDNPVIGQTVTFTVFTNASGGGFPVTTSVTAVTNADGVATRQYTAGPTAGADTIRATVAGGIQRTENLTVLAGMQATNLSIATDRTTIRSDDSQSATITVTALSSANVAVPGVLVTFSADGGVLSAFQVSTDATGQARVTLRAGTMDKSNRTVTVTASAEGTADRLIPVRVVGSTVELDSRATTLTAGAAGVQVTVTARDASGLGIFNVPVQLAQAGTGRLAFDPASGTTDVNGRFTTTVTGLNPGDVTMTAEALGATAGVAIAVAPGSVFGFDTPLPARMSTGAPFVFRVNAPAPVTRVRFASTLGGWTEASCGNLSACEVDVAGGAASATLNSASAGIATVQAQGLDASGAVVATDSHVAPISSATAAAISVQASASNVQPSSGGNDNSVAVIATVRDAAGQRVGGAPVAFSLSNTTGGGETISPAIVLSSDGVNTSIPIGQAIATFTAGSLSSASTGVRVEARVAGTALPPAFVDIVIGGTAGSVVIGRATHIDGVQSTTTHYVLPMSLLVVDTNGNPMPNRVVSLSAWPTRYGVGKWRLVNNQCEPEGNVDNTPVVWRDNEDTDESLLFAAWKDTNRDGMLTPPNSAAGSVPSSVLTDANGLARFDLVYLKQHAAWIRVRIRAATVVFGTESRGEIQFELPYSKQDAENCSLPNSPFQ